MATISKVEIVDALTELGRLAQAERTSVRLVVAGGAAMVLLFDARQSTRDVDAVVIEPSDAALVRRLVKRIAEVRGWPEDWLNDGAKGFLIGMSEGALLIDAPGVVVHSLGVAQLLAMKLCAWRDEVDINDARRLLRELHGTRDEVWKSLIPYLGPGRELKAKYAFDDLWEAREK